MPRRVDYQQTLLVILAVSVAYLERTLPVVVLPAVSAEQILTHLEMLLSVLLAWETRPVILKLEEL